MKQRKIRKKSTVSFDEEEEDGEPGSVAVPPASVKAAQAQREKERKKASDGKKSLLSFDEDLGGGDDSSSLAAKKKGSAAGVQKPPRASLRAPSATRAEAEAAAAAPNTQVSAAGEYSAERIRELQKNALRAPSAPKPAAPLVGGGGGFKLSGSFKPAGAPKDSRFQYNVNAAAVVPSPEEQQAQQAAQQAQQAQQGAVGSGAAAAGAGGMPLPPPPMPPPGAERSGSGAAAPAGAASEEEEEDGDIPDEKMIQWAKAKRERLRAAHLAPDYIPTASVPGLSRLRDKKAAEEAVGCEEGSGSEDEAEEHMRLQFMGAAPGKRSSKSVVAAAAAARDAEAGGLHREGGGEEEDEEFVAEQIRKGMGGLMRGEAPGGAAAAAGGGGGGGSGAAAAAGGVFFQGGGAAGMDLGGGPMPAAPGFGLGGSQAGKINAAAEAVMQALQHGLQRLQATHKQADRNLARTGQSLQGALDAIGRLEGELGSASDKYVFLQKTRAYVQDLCYMLQDKSPLVEELEEHLQRLYEDRAAAFQKLRRLDDEESLQPAEAAVSAALGVLSHGGAPAAAATAADVAADAAEQRQLAGGDMPVELDEFGRDVNAERRQEAAERAKRRTERLQSAEAQRRQQQQRSSSGGGGGGGSEPAPAELRLGEATSEESEGETAHFKLRQGEIQEAADAVFRDADDEFSSISAVKSQLEGWKARYPGAYRDAYMAITAPALFAPFVRLELLKWRPLEGALGFDVHQWYQQLFDFGMGWDPAAADPDDPDANLVPQLVQKLVLPLARHLLEAVWDPLSRRQSRAAATMLGDLLVYVPPEDESLQALLRDVQSRLEAAVEATSLPAWPPLALAASHRAECYLCHRFGRALRLLQNICAFEGVLPRSVLQALALERLLAGRLLPYMRVAASDMHKAVDRIHRTVALLPPEWFKGGPLRGCEGLLELCNSLARSLEAQAQDASARGANAPLAKQLSDAVIKLGGDATKANRLAKLYGVL